MSVSNKILFISTHTSKHCKCRFIAPLESHLHRHCVLGVYCNRHLLNVSIETILYHDSIVYVVKRVQLKHNSIFKLNTREESINFVLPLGVPISDYYQNIWFLLFRCIWQSNNIRVFLIISIVKN